MTHRPTQDRHPDPTMPSWGFQPAAVCSGGTRNIRFAHRPRSIRDRAQQKAAPLPGAAAAGAQAASFSIIVLKKWDASVHLRASSGVKLVELFLNLPLSIVGLDADASIHLPSQMSRPPLPVPR